MQEAIRDSRYSKQEQVDNLHVLATVSNLAHVMGEYFATQ